MNASILGGVYSFAGQYGLYRAFEIGLSILVCLISVWVAWNFGLTAIIRGESIAILSHGQPWYGRGPSMPIHGAIARLNGIVRLLLALLIFWISVSVLMFPALIGPYSYATFIIFFTLYFSSYAVNGYALRNYGCESLELKDFLADCWDATNNEYASGRIAPRRNGFYILLSLLASAGASFGFLVVRSLISIQGFSWGYLGIAATLALAGAGLLFIALWESFGACEIALTNGALKFTWKFLGFPFRNLWLSSSDIGNIKLSTYKPGSLPMFTEMRIIILDKSENVLLKTRWLSRDEGKDLIHNVFSKVQILHQA